MKLGYLVYQGMDDDPTFFAGFRPANGQPSHIPVHQMRLVARWDNQQPLIFRSLKGEDGAFRAVLDIKERHPEISRVEVMQINDGVTWSDIKEEDV